LVQLYGEGKISASELQKQSTQADKIINAAKVIKSKYDKYLGQLNTVLVRNGYDPIKKRKDYFHHFQELGNVFESIGVSLKAHDLPTDINGLTADFKPGRTFFNATLQRKGDKTAIDAIGGIDKYLEGASNQIFHTDNIQRLRAFEETLRSKYAGTNHLSSFVANLTEYTNVLAGKKSMLDRGTEALLGRPIYTALNTVKKQVGANMVGANVSSALTNFIPLTQTLATTSKTSVLQALMSTIKNVFKNDGFIDSSDFLTTRIGADRLNKNLWENVGDKSGWLFKTVDSLVSQIVTRSKYYEALKQGKSEKAAMNVANTWARKLLAGRGKGEMPTLFNAQTLGFLTQFQLEVNNQLSFMTKDIPRNFDKAGTASAIGQLFLYSYIFNNIYEKIAGRRPAFDPIGVAQQTYEDYTNPDMKKGQATKNLVGNVSNQLPFASTFTGGRIPLTSAIPNPIAVANGESTIMQEAVKPLQFMLPTGGGQIKKIYEGTKAYNQGASTTPSGLVRFPIPQTLENRIRTGVFGQWSTPEAEKYIREGQGPLSDKQSKQVMDSKNKQSSYNMIMGAKQVAAKEQNIRDQVLASGQEQTYNGKKYYLSKELDTKTGEYNPVVKSTKVSQTTSELYKNLPKEYETESDSPKNILSKVVVYGTGIFKDPEGTINAIKTGQPIRKVRGDAVVVERIKNLASLDQGDKDTEVDHIIPIALGGDNSESNLAVISKQDNRAKGIVDTYLASELEAGRITKKVAQERDLNWRNEINNLPPDKKSAATTILSQKPVASKPIATTQALGILSTLANKTFEKIKTVDSNGVTKYSDVQVKIPIYPTLTGQTEVDKALKSKYTSALSTAKSNIIKLHLAGQITAQEANDALLTIKLLNSSKGTGSTLSSKKIQTAYKKLMTNLTKLAKFKEPKSLKSYMKSPNKLKLKKYTLTKRPQ